MIYCILAAFGLLFGSFVTALSWRLHEKLDFVNGRSQCEYCGHTLAAIDLVPVISWVILRGRCRYCNVAISWQNPIIEASVAIAFVVSYLAWPFALSAWQAQASFGLWLLYIVLLATLFVYDLRWMVLPDALVLPLIALGLLDVALRLSAAHNLTLVAYAQQVLLGGCALGGVYLLLYVISKGRWIGSGDVKLGWFIGMILGWEYALCALFLANILCAAIVLPVHITGKLPAKSRVPFGPFLIIAFVLMNLFGPSVHALLP
jgi:prepilin signal peptidase PulO-like enzyme (type II secretory pathway)